MSKRDYRDTLNLPKTTFSMKANLTALEPKILNLWSEIDIYKKIRENNTGKKKFILHDGPPYANGLIHIGHALNKILKDTVIKFKMMKGFDCPFIVGWDCHGLPVEHQLFKELNLTKYDVDVVDFRKKANRFALKFVELQKEDFERLGVFSDWQNPYLTLSGDYEYWVLRLLQSLVKDGYIYRGRRPVNWCANCETALAEAEVEYKDKESHSIYLLFKVKDNKGILEEKEIYFLVWTTTPWTLIANVAVAVHPDLDYGIYRYKNKLILFAKDLKETLEKKIATKFPEVKVFCGKDLSSIVLSHPFIDRDSRVILADFVSKEEGSGCVHIAPGHGEEDFSMVKKYNLNLVMSVNEKGIFTQEAGKFSGKDVKEASISVIEDLRDKNQLLKHEKIFHSYPHCWRCKSPIIFRATHQWFLNVDHKNLRNDLLDMIEKVNWIPPQGLARIRSMIMTRPDWCLSRQRLWGIPIPALRCDNCKTIILESKVIEKVAQIFREESSDSWFTQSTQYFLPENFSCPNCNRNSFSKECDILDVWFESGASFLAVVKNNKDLRFPSDMYLEGSDQHRGWFQVSLVPSAAQEKQPPFQIILTHGFVVDGEGKKMSKSLGNVIAPQQIIKDYGAEILRIWVAASDYTEDIKISHQIIKQLTDVYRKIRNTIRFILGNLYDFDIDRDYITKDSLLEIDRFMLSKTFLNFRDVLNDYENFSFHKVYQKIFNFCNIELSSFYLDILKDRLYTYSPNSKERKSAQNVLYYILRVLIKMIAPILSFTAEETYGCFFNWKNKKESIYLHNFQEDFHQDYLDEELIQRGKKILALRGQVLKEIEKKRESGFIGSSLEAEVKLSFNANDYNFYKDRQELLREVFIVSSLSIKKGNFKIEIKKAKGKKCLRCWNWNQNVGKDKNHPELCPRCIKVLKGGK